MMMVSGLILCINDAINHVHFSAVTVSFEMEQYSTVEGDDVTVCIVLSGQSERAVAVRVSTAEGEAQGT